MRALRARTRPGRGSIPAPALAAFALASGALPAAGARAQDDGAFLTAREGGPAPWTP